MLLRNLLFTAIIVCSSALLIRYLSNNEFFHPFALLQSKQYSTIKRPCKFSMYDYNGGRVKSRDFAHFDKFAIFGFYGYQKYIKLGLQSYLDKLSKLKIEDDTVLFLVSEKRIDNLYGFEKMPKNVQLLYGSDASKIFACYTRALGSNAASAVHNAKNIYIIRGYHFTDQSAYSGIGMVRFALFQQYYQHKNT